MLSRILNAVLGQRDQPGSLPLDGRSRSAIVIDGDGAALAVTDTAGSAGEIPAMAVRVIHHPEEPMVERSEVTTVADVKVTMQQRQKLQLFRTVAAEARDAALLVRGQSFPLLMKNGYIESSGIDRLIQALCIPVRRAYMRNDPVNFTRIIKILHAIDAPELRERIAAVESKYSDVMRGLRTPAILNDQRVTFEQFLGVWFEAAVYMEFADKRAQFDAIVKEFGKAVEGIVLHATHQMADCIIELDAVTADLLGEQHLPPAKPPGEAV